MLDPRAVPLGWTPRLDPWAGPPARTPLDPKERPLGWTPGLDPLSGPQGWNPFLEPEAGSKGLTLGWTRPPDNTLGVIPWPDSWGRSLSQTPRLDPWAGPQGLGPRHKT